jgi:hypothetical protein
LGYEKAKVIDEAIEAKDGKTETEDIGELHDWRRDGGAHDFYMLDFSRRVFEKAFLI